MVDRQLMRAPALHGAAGEKRLQAASMETVVGGKVLSTGDVVIFSSLAVASASVCCDDVSTRSWREKKSGRCRGNSPSGVVSAATHVESEAVFSGNHGD